MAYAGLVNTTTGIQLAFLGGNGGGGIVFAKPIAVASGQVFSYSVINQSNHATSLGITVWGYEI
jgi:hypothetical protein